MKKEMKMIVAAVVVAVVVIAGYFVMTTDASEWAFPWSNTTVFDGEWKTNVKLTFADGNTETFEDVQNGDTLTVYYNGAVVTSVQWWLEAKAMTPTGSDAYSGCEIDVGQTGTLSLATRIATIEVGGQPGTNVYTDTHSFSDTSNVEIDVDTVLYQTVVGAPSLTLNSATEGLASESYYLTFAPYGTCYYRGVGADYPTNPDDHGDWVSINPPPVLTFTIEVDNIAPSVTVDFNSNVIWS